MGKAAAAMLRGAPAPERGLAVLPEGDPRVLGLPGVEVLFASHPEPDRTSVRAARRAIRFFSGFGPRDVIVCLVSGGASSLLCLPRSGVTLREKRARVRRLVESGASVEEVNRLRSSLSAVKGGRLGRTTAARLVTLVLSDVPGDSPGLVGSGPTVRGGRGDRVLVVGSNRDGLAAAARAARARGLRPRRLLRRLDGEAREAGLAFGRRSLALVPGEVLLAGGETTVARPPLAPWGRGGRSLELALAAAQVLDGSGGIALLAAGSDGRDGSSRAAGAYVDGDTISRARSAGIDPASALASHDSEPFFEACGGLFVTGPTGTNVADWVFAVRVGRRT